MSRAREKNWSEEHTSGAEPNGMGSDFGGDQRGQIELHAAAGLARKQQLGGNLLTELVRQVIPLCNRSGARVQLKEFMGVIHAGGVTQVTPIDRKNERPLDERLRNSPAISVAPLRAFANLALEVR
jgi:hypothetical protein